MAKLAHGIDLVDFPRIEEMVNSHGGRFLDRIFTRAEQDYADDNRNTVEKLAGRFAAKEAVVKAMGTGFRHGMWIRDAGVVQNQWGRPEIIWSSRGAAMRDSLGIGEGHISLTDEAGLVVAVAVLLRAQS